MRKLLYIVIFLSQFILVSYAQSTQTNEEILNFVSRITVNPNTSLDVTETITVYANQNKIRHGLTRWLPEHYIDSSGIIHHTTYQITRTQMNNQNVMFQTENRDNHFFLKVGDPNTTLEPGIYQFTIQYHIKDAINLTANQDEFYWNITGESWDFPIVKAETQILFPPGTQISKYEAYTGKRTAPAQDLKITQPTANQILFTTTQPILPNESLIIKAIWPKGITVGPSIKEKANLHFQLHTRLYVSTSLVLIFLTTLGICILMVRSSRRKIQKLREKAY